jgi:hypothetical protein
MAGQGVVYQMEVALWMKTIHTAVVFVVDIQYLGRHQGTRYSGDMDSGDILRRLAVPENTRLQ